MANGSPGSMLRNSSVARASSKVLLPEQYLAIDPGSPQKPALAANAVVKGIDPILL